VLVWYTHTGRGINTSKLVQPWFRPVICSHGSAKNDVKGGNMQTIFIVNHAVEWEGIISDEWLRPEGATEQPYKQMICRMHRLPWHQSPGHDY